MAWLAVAYLLFVVYGSLFPFDWHGRAVGSAWMDFHQVLRLPAGAGNRADWVANVLLYIPLGFLFCGWLVGRSRRSWAPALGLGITILFAAALAITLEFTQTFFARTVSLNDFYANSLGGALGAALWPFFGARLMRLLRTLFQRGEPARQAALIAYSLGYLVLSLFPYDFLMSFQEWRQHLVSGSAGRLFAENCGRHCALKLIPEGLAVAPLGMLAALVFRRRATLARAAAAGLLLGVLIEGLQVLIASGISQGASVVSRGIGALVGVVLWRLADGIEWRRVRGAARAVVMLGGLPYFALLAWANHWFVGPWLSARLAVARLADTSFLPFYYHYYTSEAGAVVSLLYQFALYFPMGIAVWLWCWGSRAEKCAQPSLLSMLAAGVTATVIEAGKLFITSQHPDPTNVLIAGVAATTADGLLRVMFTEASWSTAPHKQVPLVENIAIEPVAPPALKPRSFCRWLIGIVALCVALVAAASHPLGIATVLLPLIVYIALLWLRPGLWLVLVPALLPILDWAPWSGRFFWTEFDTLLVATLGVGYLRLRANTHSQPVMRFPAKWLLAGFTLSAIISLGLGLLPLSPVDFNAFTHYTSSFNSLRAAKALFFALLFIPLLTRAWDDPPRAAGQLALGISLGLAIEVLYVLWERVTFSGLLNFENDYRISGSFPGMHIGGASIEGYLVTVLPFVLLWAWQQRRAVVTALAIILYALGAYSVMVTFSRGGQIAFMLTTLIAVFGFARLALRDHARRFAGVGALLVMGGAIVVVVWPIFSGKYSESRLASSVEDASIRMRHWSDVLSIVEKRDAAVFGVGLGTFPAAYFWGSREPARPATYSFLSENGNVFLRLGSGDTLYFQQPVAVKPERRYRLSMDLRASAKNAILTAPLCEKPLLSSYTCAWSSLELKAPPGQWAHYETTVHSANFGPPGSAFPRPVKLSLFNGGGGAIMDVDNVALYDEAGRNLLRNGDFSAGMRYWFFTTDNHLAWHVENLFIHVLFEQGWLGLICFLSLLAYTATRLLRPAWVDDPLRLTLFAALAAFLLVGMLNTLIDETRIGFLLYFLLLTTLIAEARLSEPVLHPVANRAT